MQSIIKVPVSKFVKSYIFKKYSHKIVDGRYLDFRSKQIGCFGSVKGYIIESLEDFAAPDPSVFQDEKLEIILSGNLKKKGLNTINAKRTGSFLDGMVKYEMVNFVSILSSIPFFSRAEVIKIFYNYYGMTDESYDFEHFRRYFDRYCFGIAGDDFRVISKKFNSFLIDYVNQKAKNS